MNNKQLLLTTLAFSLLSLPSSAAAINLMPDGINLGIGQSLFKKADLSREALALRWDWNRDFMTTPNWRLDGYFELGYSQWRSHLSSSKVRSVYAADDAWQVSFAPVFRLQPEQFSGEVTPFFDFGVGLSYQSEEDIEQERLSAINMGGHGQFEIRAMIGVQLGASKQFEIAYGWHHYSNAYLRDENEGLDFQSLHVHYRW